jgi:hypothetical protein
MARRPAVVGPAGPGALSPVLAAPLRLCARVGRAVGGAGAHAATCLGGAGLRPVDQPGAGRRVPTGRSAWPGRAARIAGRRWCWPTAARQPAFRLAERGPAAGRCGSTSARRRPAQWPAGQALVHWIPSGPPCSLAPTGAGVVACPGRGPCLAGRRGPGRGRLRHVVIDCAPCGARPAAGRWLRTCGHAGRPARRPRCSGRHLRGGGRPARPRAAAVSDTRR